MRITELAITINSSVYVVIGMQFNLRDLDRQILYLQWSNSLG